MYRQYFTFNKNSCENEFFFKKNPKRHEFMLHLNEIQIIEETHIFLM